MSKRLFELRTMPYEQYLQTPEWAEKRQLVLQRDDYRCRLCNTEDNLHVHHRTYIRRGNEDLNDLTTLCEACHENFHMTQSQDEIMVRTYNPPVEEKTKEQQIQARENGMLDLLTDHPGLISYVYGLIRADDFISAETRNRYSALISLQQTVNVEKDDAELIKTAIGYATRLKREWVRQIITDLSQKADAAVHAGDKEMVSRLTTQIAACQRELRTLYSASHLMGGR